MKKIRQKCVEVLGHWHAKKKRNLIKKPIQKHLKHFSYSREDILSMLNSGSEWEEFRPLVDIWQCPQTLLVVTKGVTSEWRPKVLVTVP